MAPWMAESVRLQPHLDVGTLVGITILHCGHLKMKATLTDTKVRQANPTAKPHKLFDGGGLYLYVTPQGAKLWRYRYRWQGQQKTMSFNPYPGLTLAEARKQHGAARELLNRGIDPMCQDIFLTLRRARNRCNAILPTPKIRSFTASGPIWLKHLMETLWRTENS